MMIGAISNSYDPYARYAGYPGQTVGRGMTEPRADASGGRGFAAGLQNFKTSDGSVRVIDKEHNVKKGYKSSPAECTTCRERKYKDGSNESDVSFKAPGHIDPQASASMVMAHEQQHVSNAYQKASEKGGDVVSCSVSLRTAVCPECGTVYVSGGTTSTAISYPDESNPYQKDKKAKDAVRYVGANIDYVA